MLEFVAIGWVVMIIGNYDISKQFDSEAECRNYMINEYSGPQPEAWKCVPFGHWHDTRPMKDREMKDQ